jgi:hypothetical protein
MTTEPSTEQPYGPGGICDECGHFAGRHAEDGCDTADLVLAGIRKKPCKCKGMLWLGVRWPRPWLPAPDGLVAS